MLFRSQSRLAALEAAADLDGLQAAAAAAGQAYQARAAALSAARQQAAGEMGRAVSEVMQQLALSSGRFEIALLPLDGGSVHGLEQIEFRVGGLAGNDAKPLAKVASGGELSRISLAIQVITARKMETPALIFDEVDVGISGPTAAVVGKMLRQLGESTQVMCVTHLPQVAGCGHQHFYVSKETDGAMTETHMQPLDKRARLQELARLLGGSEVTRNTLANAKELLAA